MSTSPAVPQLALAGSDVAIPQLGFGVFKIPDDETQRAVETALEVGYRHIDTATIYRNEVGVGRALAASSLARSEVFVTSKLWSEDFAPGQVRPAVERSLEKLGLEQLDLYLLHWPSPDKRDFINAWTEVLQAVEDGLLRAAGVSNFTPELLDRLIAATGVTPPINQVKVNPALQQKGLQAYHAAHNILTEAWGPIGQGAGLDDPIIGSVAAAHGVTPAQAVLRWHIQEGRVVIPKSVHRERMVENLDVFGFELTPDEIAQIDALDAGAPVWDEPLNFQP